MGASIVQWLKLEIIKATLNQMLIIEVNKCSILWASRLFHSISAMILVPSQLLENISSPPSMLSSYQRFEKNYITDCLFDNIVQYCYSKVWYLGIVLLLISWPFSFIWPYLRSRVKWEVFLWIIPTEDLNKRPVGSFRTWMLLWSSAALPIFHWHPELAVQGLEGLSI